MDDLRLGRQQHLQVGGMQMAARRKIDFGEWLLLQPFEQSFGFVHTDYIGKKRTVLLEFDRDQTISRQLRIISTDPSPSRADPE